MTEMDSKLVEIISMALLIENEQINDDLSRETYEPWDSMAHLLLVSEIENAFNVYFEDEEITSMKTIKDVKNFLRKKI